MWKLPNKCDKDTVARDFGPLIPWMEPLLTPLIQTLNYFWIRFRIREDIRKNTCISAVRDSGTVLYCGISAFGDSAKLDLQRLREVSFSAVSNSADADLALSSTALIKIRQRCNRHSILNGYCHPWRDTFKKFTSNMYSPDTIEGKKICSPNVKLFLTQRCLWQCWCTYSTTSNN